MAIDKPLDQARALIESEERSGAPFATLKKAGLVAGTVSKLAAVLLLAKTSPEAAIALLMEAGKSASELFAADSSKFLMEVVIRDLEYLTGKIDDLPAERKRFLEEEFPRLWLEADRISRQTRAKERIERIGAILCHSAGESSSLSVDETEELMRVAQMLDDRDIIVLRALCEQQKKIFNTADGRAFPERANDLWMAGVTESAASGITMGERQSRYAKLQACGLISQVERNPMKVSPGSIVYVILQRAVDFVTAIQRERQVPASE